MPLPRPRTTFERFFGRLTTAPRRVLFADFDGTLAPFAEHPDSARPYPGVTRLLDEIAEQGDTRLVIVTGRSLDQHVPHLGLKRMPEMWGAHGWQCRTGAGKTITLEVPTECRALLAIAAARADALVRDGARIERKPASVAVHWRGLDARGARHVGEALLRAWRELQRMRDLDLLHFDGGMELRIRGLHKGSVVRRVLEESGPGATGAYLGDDRTDEDAFVAIRGRGCGVLVRPEWRRTEATLWLRPPQGVIAFLTRWRDCERAAQEARVA